MGCGLLGRPGPVCVSAPNKESQTDFLNSEVSPTTYIFPLKKKKLLGGASSDIPLSFSQTSDRGGLGHTKRDGEKEVEKQPPSSEPFSLPPFPLQPIICENLEEPELSK